jgi:hypothetical protein
MPPWSRTQACHILWKTWLTQMRRRSSNPSDVILAHGRSFDILPHQSLIWSILQLIYISHKSSTISVQVRSSVQSAASTFDCDAVIQSSLLKLCFDIILYGPHHRPHNYPGRTVHCFFIANTQCNYRTCLRLLSNSNSSS